MVRFGNFQPFLRCNTSHWMPTRIRNDRARSRSWVGSGQLCAGLELGWPLLQATMQQLIFSVLFSRWEGFKHVLNEVRSLLLRRNCSKISKKEIHLISFQLGKGWQYRKTGFFLCHFQAPFRIIVLWKSLALGIAPRIQANRYMHSRLLRATSRFLAIGAWNTICKPASEETAQASKTPRWRRSH